MEELLTGAIDELATLLDDGADETGAVELEDITAALDELSALLDEPVSLATHAVNVTDAVPSSTVRQ